MLGLEQMVGAKSKSEESNLETVAVSKKATMLAGSRVAKAEVGSERERRVKVSLSDGKYKSASNWAGNAL